MTTGRKWWAIGFVVLLMAGLGAQSLSADSGDQFARAASDSIGPYLIAGELTLALDGKKGKQEAVQAAKALVVTGLATQALKAIVRDKRPNSDSLTSFPSGHTSAAFAMATCIADYKPKYKWLAYGTAAIIGWSRVRVHDHEWDEVVAGALLGHYIAKHYTTAKNVTVSPTGISFRF